MADIKVKEGDRVIVYRNMPHLEYYPEEVMKGTTGTVHHLGGGENEPFGLWALIITNSGDHKYVKLTYLKHA